MRLKMGRHCTFVRPHKLAQQHIHEDMAVTSLRPHLRHDVGKEIQNVQELVQMIAFLCLQTIGHL